MDIRKIINRRIRHSGDGVDVVGDVNAVIAANVNERGLDSCVEQAARRSACGKTVVSEQRRAGGMRMGSDER